MTSPGTDPTSDPSSDDQLDELLSIAMDSLENGEDPAIDALVADAPHLHSRLTKLVNAARSAINRPDVRLGAPEIPGYVIEQRIGAGGMGIVYRARQDRLGGRAIALKVLPPAMALSRDARARFRIESRTVARLSHPNIVTVYDVIEEKGVHAFVMELVDGISLARLIDVVAAHGVAASTSAPSAAPSKSDVRLELVRECLGAPARSLPFRTYERFIATVGARIADALSAVHQNDLLHRDVKPSNILIRRDGAALLTDFGLAKDSAASLHTITGQFVGTPAYASPEAANSRAGPDEARVGALSDVYSLGATLYHALAMRPPFVGDSPMAILRQVEDASLTPLARLRTGVPQDLALIVDKAMEPDPSRRYASAREMSLDLERFLAGESVAARAPSAAYRAHTFVRRHRTLVVATAAVFVTLVTGIIGTTIGLVRARESAGDAAESATLARINQYAASIQAAASALQAEDVGGAIARLVEAPKEYRGWEWRYLDAQCDQSDRAVVSAEFSDPRSGQSADFSPDGRHIAVSHAPDTIVIVDNSSGTVLAHRRVIDNPIAGLSGVPGQVRYSPDGSRLATAARSYGAVILDAATLEPLVVGDGYGTKGLARDFAILAWSPDGATVAVGGGSGDSADPLAHGLFIIDARTGALRREVHVFPSRPHCLSYSADGTRLLVTGWQRYQRGFAMLLDTSTYEPIPWPGANDVLAEAGAISPDGATIATVARRVLQFWDAKTLALRVTVNGLRMRSHSLVFSHDSSRVYFGDGTSLLGFDVATGAEVFRRRSSIGEINSLAVSPDGKTLFSPLGMRFWNVDGQGDVGHFRFPSDVHTSDDGEFVASIQNNLALIRGSAGGEAQHALGDIAPSSVNLAAFVPGTHRFLIAAGSQLRSFGASDGSMFAADVPPLIHARMNFNASATKVMLHDEAGLSVYDSATLISQRVHAPLERTSVLNTCGGLGGFVELIGRRIVVRDFDSGALVWEWTAPGDVIFASFSPDNSLMFACFDDLNFFSLVDVAHRSALLTSEKLPAQCGSVAWSNDGRRIVASMRDGTVRLHGLFDTGDGSIRMVEVLTLRAGRFWMADACFLSDNTRLFASGAWPSHQYFIWDSGRTTSRQGLPSP